MVPFLGRRVSIGVYLQSIEVGVLFILLVNYNDVFFFPFFLSFYVFAVRRVNLDSINSIRAVFAQGSRRWIPALRRLEDLSQTRVNIACCN